MTISSNKQTYGFSKTLDDHFNETDYDRVAKIVEKFRFPEAKIEKVPRFSTKALRVSQDPDPLTGALATPIHTSSTYCQKTPT